MFPKEVQRQLNNQDNLNNNNFLNGMQSNNSQRGPSPLPQNNQFVQNGQNYNNTNENNINSAQYKNPNIQNSYSPNKFAFQNQQKNNLNQKNQLQNQQQKQQYNQQNNFNQSKYNQSREKSPGFWSSQQQYQQNGLQSQNNNNNNNQNNNLNQNQSAYFGGNNNFNNNNSTNFSQQQQLGGQQFNQQKNNHFNNFKGNNNDMDQNIARPQKQVTSKSPVQRQNSGGQGGYQPPSSLIQSIKNTQKMTPQYNFNNTNGQPGQRQNTYNSNKDTEKMYFQNNQLSNTPKNMNNTQKNFLTQPNQQNLESFSHIGGSILDEGVNSNMPTSKAITASKQPFEKSPLHSNGQNPYLQNNFAQRPMGQSPTFFTNYNKSPNSRSPYGHNNNLNNINKNNFKNFNGNNNNYNKNNNFNNTSNNQIENNSQIQNPFIIKNADTGETYDLREYNKIRDEEIANNFLESKKNVKQPQHINNFMDTNNNVQPPTLNKNGYKSTSSNNLGNQQRNISPYMQNNNNINIQNKINQQNAHKFNAGPNTKSLSPTPHQNSNNVSGFNLSSNQTSNNNLSNRSSNISNLQNNSQQSNKTNNNASWQQLLSEHSKINNELILNAKINKTEKCVELLDKKRGDKRADVNAKGEDDWQPLHYAALNGNAKLLSFLLYHEAIIDGLTKQGITPLLIAAQRGYDDIFQILMTAGAEINHTDLNGDSALHHATRNNNKIIVEMLLRKPSINTELQNKQGKKAFDQIPNENIKKTFDNYFKYEQGRSSKNNKVTIQNVQNDKITQMFNSKPQDNAQNKFNTDLRSNQLSSNKQNEQNKNSINSENTTDENSGGSFNNEDKIGPNHFLVHGLIGKGSFGEVYLVEKKSNSMLYAMKVLHKNKIMRHNLTRYALTERNVLSLTNHPFIVKMQFAFQTVEKLFLILDYCPGGDLGELLQKEKKFTEERVKIYLCEIVLALEDLHQRDVIFRDLKPDNIVLDHEGHAMLTDFGLSKEGILDPNSGARSFCGSVAYLAPEMLKRCGHGKAVDWYLLGVVMYEFLVGIPPYYANNREELFYNIEKAPLKLPASLSSESKSLLKALLQRNPAKRLGSGKGDSEEIKSHKFFAGVNWQEVQKKKLKPPIPKRKIRISTKFDPNIFDQPTSQEEEQKQKIEGWSFVNPHNV